MIIGLLSDTHDNLSNLIYVLNVYRERGIELLIHCGDLVSMEMIPYFEGFRVIYTTGNMDITTGTIKKRFERIHKDNYVGTVYRGEIGGVSLAVTHSHIDGKVMDLVQEMRYKWIFHGHTHKKRDEIIQGVRIVNPGALGGLGREPRSFCVVDLDTEQVEFLGVP